MWVDIGGPSVRAWWQEHHGPSHTRANASVPDVCWVWGRGLGEGLLTVLIRCGALAFDAFASVGAVAVGAAAHAGLRVGKRPATGTCHTRHHFTSTSERGHIAAAVGPWVATNRFHS